MRKIKGIALAWVSLATLVSCGSSSQNINGPWFGTAAANPGSSLAFTFGANLAQGSGNNVTVSNVSFGSSLACFPSGFSSTATFSSIGSANGFQTGSFTMKVSTMFPSAVNNVLALQGARNSDGSISGTWILTGQTGCSGNGIFKMSLPHTDPVP
jgi:hypothetical protein